MMVAIPKYMIHNYLEFLKCAELECYSIDFSGNSLAKQIASEVDSGVGRLQNVVIVDIGHKSTTVTVTVNGKFRFHRRFPYACETMFQAVCERIHCPWDEAKSLTRKYGIMPCDETGYAGQYVDVSFAVKDVLNRLCGEIAEYFSEIGIAADKIVLVGGGSALKNIDEFMRKAFNTHVTKHTRVGNAKVDETEEADLGIYYASCLGAFKAT
jgi:Tfp pilus assembly PilM family ATPase